MRFDVKVALLVFVVIILVFAIVGWIGHDQWSDVVQ
jgi:sensor histidine kinase regulating citrate/malate metabolism